VVLLACPAERGSRIDAAAPPPVEFSAIPGTPLQWRLPAAWTVRAPEATPVVGQAPSAAGSPAVEDAGRASVDAGDVLGNTVLVASGVRSGDGSTTTQPPRVEVYLDSGLRKGTTLSDYLIANRQSQTRALGDIAIRHLEVEPIRRAGRAGFHLRDAFDVPLPQGGKAPVSQQAVLLLDGDRGYVVVVTLLEDELPRHLEEIRTWLGSIRFAAP
jgi:hypothetical protein